MVFDKFTKQAKDAAAKAMEASRRVVNNAKDAADQLGHVSKEKAQETLERALPEFNGLKPILADCGFIVGDIVFSIPLPEVLVTLEYIGEGKRTLEQVLADPESGLTDFQKAVLNLLAKANELAEVTIQYGYVFRKYDLAMTFPPRVSIHLMSIKSKG